MTAHQKPETRVLVADDNRNHCRLVKKLMEAEGYQVREASTGESAIKEFESWHPDLVILDSMLPNKCGIECLYHIKHHPQLAGTHVVMCSARTDIHYVLKCMEAGAEAFVFKPFDTEKLRTRVHHLLHRKQPA